LFQLYGQVRWQSMIKSHTRNRQRQRAYSQCRTIEGHW